jgi:hypothetical protein
MDCKPEETIQDHPVWKRSAGSKARDLPVFLEFARNASSFVYIWESRPSFLIIHLGCSISDLKSRTRVSLPISSKIAMIALLGSFRVEQSRPVLFFEMAREEEVTRSNIWVVGWMRQPLVD